MSQSCITISQTISNVQISYSHIYICVNECILGENIQHDPILQVDLGGHMPL